MAMADDATKVPAIKTVSAPRRNQFLPRSAPRNTLFTKGSFHKRLLLVRCIGRNLLIFTVPEGVFRKITG